MKSKDTCKHCTLNVITLLRCFGEGLESCCWDVVLEVLKRIVTSYLLVALFYNKLFFFVFFAFSFFFSIRVLFLFFFLYWFRSYIFHMYSFLFPSYTVQKPYSPLSSIIPLLSSMLLPSIVNSTLF